MLPLLLRRRHDPPGAGGACLQRDDPTAIHEAPEISVQVGEPLGIEMCHLILRNEAGEMTGAAWYTRTSYVQAGSAIPTPTEKGD